MTDCAGDKAHRRHGKIKAGFRCRDCLFDRCHGGVNGALHRTHGPFDMHEGRAQRGGDIVSDPARCAGHVRQAFGQFGVLGGGCLIGGRFHAGGGVLGNGGAYLLHVGHAHEPQAQGGHAAVPGRRAHLDSIPGHLRLARRPERQHQLAGAALVQGIQQGVEPLQVVLADHQRLDTEGAPLTSQVLDRGVGAFGVFVADGEATGGQVITLDNERHATKAGLPTLVPPCHRLYPPVTVNAGRME